MMMMIMMLQQNIRPKFDEKNRKVSIERNVFFLTLCVSFQISDCFPAVSPF